MLPREFDRSWARQVRNRAIALGVRRVLVLDLARVGTNAGPGTDAFCKELKDSFPDVELLAGGGVRGREDLDRLRTSGVDGVLVATALHDGRLRRDEL